MKGVVFTEFLELVEDKFSPEIADRIIAESDLESGGAYTAVGTYDYGEMVALVSTLSRVANTPVPDLLNAYGRHLFTRFHELYPAFFEDKASAFEFLADVDRYIHIEVKKLYPDAELPKFDIRTNGGARMEMTYRSPRCLADFAVGLIEGCAKHFGEAIEIRREDISAGGDGSAVRFVLEKQ